MNQELVAHILSVIKTSTDKNVILKGLVKLRTDLVKDREGVLLFHRCNGIPPMVRFLNKPHEQILEVVLSILGNCCTNADCCQEALDHKVAISLTTILKSIPNTVIQNRACRLLGNLAKANHAKLLSTHCPAIASAVCQIIEECNDIPTQIMCFRACRSLLADKQFVRQFLLMDGFMLILRTLMSVVKNTEVKEPPEVPQKTGGLKKNEHREKYFEEVARHLEGIRSDIFDKEILKNTKACTDYIMPTEKASVELACEILKCFVILSEIQISLQTWEVVHKSNCMAAIVIFATDDNPYRSMALKILSNFSKHYGAVHALGAADAIVAACELLICKNLGDKSLSESEVRHCISVICMLSGDACNRSKIRRSGAIGKLLEIARTATSQTVISSILYVLNNFQYDNISMDLMLREGLITLLINELEQYLHSDDEYRTKKREDKKNTSRKRKTTENSTESSNKVQKMREESIYEIESPSSSPRSQVSPSSPCSSRSMSPTGSGFKMTAEDESDSETYSPVCSDDEGLDDDEDPKTDDSQNSDIMKLLAVSDKPDAALEDNIMDKEDDEDDCQEEATVKIPKFGNSPSSPIDIIENLIFRVTLLVQKRGELSKPETLNVLIGAIRTFGLNNCFCGSLTNILSESQFFAQIVKLGVIHQLFKMTQQDELQIGGQGFLDTLTSVGESHYGKGELSCLLRLDETSQKRASIAVGFLIKNHRTLYHLLTEFNVLNNLFSMILNDDNDLTIEASDALTTMCRKTLNITIPPADEDTFDIDQIFDETTINPDSYDCDMKFIVHEDDIQTPVNYNKQLLSDVSEVFKSMLNSNFREGKEGEIHLRNYSVSGLKYFLNLIECMSIKKLPNIPPAKQYKSLIEALELSRVYIIPELESVIFSIVVHYLDETNCQSVLEWSMKNYHVELTEIAINYYLCSEISADSKIKLFRKADLSMYSSEWHQMITDAILAKVVAESTMQ